MGLHRWIPALALATSLPLSAFAGAFGVSPIRVDLDPASRTGLVNVTNDDERKLSFQLKLFEWTQSASGEDQYADSADLLFFPQIFTLAPKERRLVRIGLKGASSGDRERAYRLFIEEMPDTSLPPGSGAQIEVLLRFGVPIFLSTGKGEAQPELLAAEPSKGAVRVSIRNGGTRQIRFEEVALASGDRTIAKTAGWYVFPGVTRVFTVPVTAQDCPVPASVEVRATGEGKEIRRTVDIPPALCAP
jgi:fimbrial chaperone protein